jgi:CRP-like cAMP-binding protein
MFRAKPIDLPDGQAIFVEGAPSELAFLIESGEVEITTERAGDGRLIRLATLGPGELVGEMSLVDERPRSATARALGAVRAQPFTRDEFEQLILQRPDASLRLIRALFERLRVMNARVGRLETSEPEAPVAVAATAANSPRARIIALTEEARRAIPAEGLDVARLPLRIGRDGAGALDLNELLLSDERPHQVSRNHCSLERDGAGIIVRDRGSYLGTYVNGHRIGGKRTEDSVSLSPGENELIVGRKTSVWRFRVDVYPGEEASAAPVDAI